MPRGIKWDDLPNNFAKFRPEEPKQVEEPISIQESTSPQIREINIVQDVTAVGKRITFGVIVSMKTNCWTDITIVTALLVWWYDWCLLWIC